MTTTRDPATAPLSAAARAHHGELQAKLTQRTEALLAAVINRPAPARAPTCSAEADRPVSTMETPASVDVRERPADSSGKRAVNLPVDLRGLDYYACRQELFAALRALLPGQQLQLVSEQVDDFYWLRYEAEARMRQRYRWSPARDMPGAVQTFVRLP